MSSPLFTKIFIAYLEKNKKKRHKLLDSFEGQSDKGMLRLKANKLLDNIKFTQFLQRLQFLYSSAFKKIFPQWTRIACVYISNSKFRRFKTREYKQISLRVKITEKMVYRHNRGFFFKNIVNYAFSLFLLQIGLKNANLPQT